MGVNGDLVYLALRQHSDIIHIVLKQFIVPTFNGFNPWCGKIILHNNFKFLYHLELRIDIFVLIVSCLFTALVPKGQWRLYKGVYDGLLINYKAGLLTKANFKVKTAGWALTFTEKICLCGRKENSVNL